MAVNDVYKVDFYSHAHDRQFITSFHYRETVEDIGPFPAAAINAAWQIAILPPLRGLLSTETYCGAIHTRRIVGGEGPTSRGYFVDGNGSRSGEAMPGNQALLVQLNGTHQGRPSRGKQYISGLSESDCDGNQWNGDLLNTEVFLYMDQLMQTLTGVAPSTGEWEFGYMARAGVLTTDPPLAWPGQFVRPVSLTGRNIPATIRSRQGTHQAARAM